MSRRRKIRLRLLALDSGCLSDGGRRLDLGLIFEVRRAQTVSLSLTLYSLYESIPLSFFLHWSCVSSEEVWERTERGMSPFLGSAKFLLISLWILLVDLVRIG